MKRIFALLLALVMLTGCAAPAIQTDPTQTQSTAAQEPTSTEDDTMNVLMVGNSFCYYFCDELYGMLASVGIKARISNVYYSGCVLEQHWNWWKNNSMVYEFITHDENGKRSQKGANLTYCLKQDDWDVITLQEGSTKMRNGDPVKELEASSVYRKELYELFAQKQPQAKLYWHHTWAYQTGFDSSGYQVDSAEQTAYHERQRAYALGVCQENNVARIPSGDAWSLVRDGGYDELCARIGVNGGLGDFYHDGDIGGGQYLNACVWFETLTGQSCIGNTFRPDYELSEELIAKLQAAAHQAVENLRSE